MSTLASTLAGASGRPSTTFKAKLDNVGALVIILKAIAYKDKANCIISPQGIRFVIEDSHVSQARAYLQESHFRDFSFPIGVRGGSRIPQLMGDGGENDPAEDDDPNEISFSVDVRTLLYCLTIFGGSSSNISTGAGSGGYRDGHGSYPSTQNYDTRGGFGASSQKTSVAVRITCPLDGNELSLTLEERGVVTMCQLTTFEADPLTQLHGAFAEQRVISKVIMKSDWLKEAFSELDGTSDKVTLLISPNAPYFRLSASGLAGETQMDYPKDTDVVESFHCLQTASNSYKYSLLQPCLRALEKSSLSSIRVNETGFLSIQFMIPLTDHDVTFVEYLVSPLVEPEDGGVSDSE
ncbi:Rad1/Rec1/Rad17 [Powellomyces hirtus]|nr:Rad1/Rec1/Rad17 [Powellomyces hirtus]